MYMKNKHFIIFGILIGFIIFPLMFTPKASAQCGIYPDGFIITSDSTPNDGMDTEDDIITITWWWWRYLDPPNIYCNFNVSRFEIIVYNADYPLGLDAILIQGSNYTLQDIQLSITLNLSEFVIHRIDMKFGIFFALWHEVEEGSQYPSYATWYEIRWFPRPLQPRTIIEIPNYVYIVFPILGLMTMTYYLYWKTTCKNDDNWDDERCIKKREYVKGKELEVQQQQEELSKKLFGE